MKTELEAVRTWAKEKIASGAEPPWAWYQYMKLIETTDAILSGMDYVTATESSQQSDAHLDARLRVVDSKYLQDTAQPHQAGIHVQMPM
jgi:hypothetical protein